MIGSPDILHFQKTLEKPLHRTIEADVVVLGLGILGLLIAKRLTDLGQKVVMVEKSKTVAYGPSVKNHGWLHTGTVHSLSVTDETTAQRLVQKLQYGYDFYHQYASECIEDRFIPTYALTTDGALADKARTRWTTFHVPYRELDPAEFCKTEPNLRPDLVKYVFESQDTRINNRMLFMKLLANSRKNGATFLPGARYIYTPDHMLEVSTQEDTYRVEANTFIYTTGANLAQSYKQLTDAELSIQFWKSHLLLLSRFTTASTVFLDREAPIIINHGETSVVNRSYDETPLTEPNIDVDDTEVEKALQILLTYYPGIPHAFTNIHAIACMKPNISSTEIHRHSVDSTLYEPVPGHIFALPGKMTEAPYVADEIVQHIYSSLQLEEITRRPIDEFQSGTFWRQKAQRAGH